MSKDPRSEQPAESASSDASGVIQSVSREARKFPPSAGFKAHALLSDSAEYERQAEESEKRHRRNRYRLLDTGADERGVRSHG